MKLSYSHYLLSCLMHEIDQTFAEMEYDVRFNFLPWQYAQFEASKFDDEDKPEYECIVEYLHARNALREAIKSHDFTYEYSDDSSVYNRGRISKAAIMGQASMFSNTEFKELWNEFAPNIMKIKD